MMDLTLLEIARAVGGRLLDPAGAGTRRVNGVSTDSRTVGEGQLFIALVGERFDAHDFVKELPETIGGVLVSRELDTPLAQIVVEDTRVALGTLGAYWKSVCAPRVCVGVTGSVGKTTTKELIGGVLKQQMSVHLTQGNFNNAIGLPLTLLDLPRGSEALVCEMGMSDFGEISYLSGLCRPNIAVITNIGTSHMQQLGSREGIRDAKLEIIDGMRPGDTLILNGDEPLLKDLAIAERISHLNVVTVGFDRECDVYPTDIYRGKTSLSFDIVSADLDVRVSIPAVGDHFILNALCAFAVARAAGVSSRAIVQGLLDYRPAGLRQRIYSRGGVDVIADCYNASPESMSAALLVLAARGGRRVAVLGDMMELGDLSESAHTGVGAKVAEAGIDLLYTYGEYSRAIAEGAVGCGMRSDAVHHFTEAEALARALKEELCAGDSVLFKASRKMKLEEIILLCELGE